MNKKLKTVADTIAAQCIAVRVRLLNRVVTAVYDSALRPLGLTINQLNMLVAIAKMGEATAKQIHYVLQMEPSTISRNVERMRKEGWIKSVAGGDARTVELSITSKGAHLIEKAMPAWQKSQTHAQKLLGDSTMKAIARLSGNL
jgi:DNA-binding MarR family transcriptional regulator